MNSFNHFVDDLAEIFDLPEVKRARLAEIFDDRIKELTEEVARDRLDSEFGRGDYRSDY